MTVTVGEDVTVTAGEDVTVTAGEDVTVTAGAAPLAGAFASEAGESATERC